MADITLDSYRTAVAKVARPNRFLMTFEGLPGSLAWPDEFTYHVRTTSIPSKTIGPVEELFWMGQNNKLAGDPTYEDIDITITNNENFQVREMFEKWLDIISHTVTNVRADPSGYKATMIMKHLGSDGTAIAEYFCHGVWPKNVAAIELSHGSQDQVEEFTVSMSIDTWTGNSDQTTGAGVVNILS